jgi:hypothetical protein
VTQLRAEILVGQRYRFLNRLGTDPLTETWKAFDTRLGRPVALQLLSEHARDNVGAQAGLRAIAGVGTPSSSRHDASGRRVLEGGEDPVYGPFVVTELGSGESTRRLPTLDPAIPTPPDGFQMSPNRGVLIVAAVVGVILVLLVGFVVVAYVLEPANKPSGVAVATPQQVAAPPSSAPAAAAPSLAPTQPTPQQAQAAQQPTSLPTSPPAALPAPQAGAQPSPQGGAQSKPTAGSPVDTIRQHYTFIDAKRFAEGYALMDAHLRSLNSSADYQSWFVDKISVKPVSVEVASQTDTEAIVRAVVDTTDRVDGQNVTKRVSEEFVLHPEDGAWRIDQVSSI